MFFLGDVLSKKTTMPTAQTALKGREIAIPTTTTHAVSGKALHGPFPEALEKSSIWDGVFWGAERRFLANGRRLCYGRWLCRWLNPPTQHIKKHAQGSQDMRKLF